MGLEFVWCGGERADVVHALTQLAFAPQHDLDPPSGALRETVDVVRADLEAGRGVLGRREDVYVVAARVLLGDDHLHVRRLAVHPDAQRQGVATAAMRWLQDEARALGFREIRLGFRTPLTSNRRFYQQLDYEVVAVHDFWTEMRRPL